MKHVKRFLALSLAAALLAGCVSCGNSDEKTSPTGGGSGVDSTGDGGTLRIAMTCAALPNTDSEPTEGQEGYRFVSFQLYDALVKWDASSETEAGKIIPGLGAEPGKPQAVDVPSAGGSQVPRRNGFQSGLCDLCAGPRDES